MFSKVTTEIFVVKSVIKSGSFFFFCWGRDERLMSQTKIRNKHTYTMAIIISFSRDDHYLCSTSTQNLPYLSSVNSATKIDFTI